EIPIVHKSSDFFREVYQLGPSFPKKDQFGIYLRIENLSLELVTLGITASFEQGIQKLPTLRHLRRNIELVKRLIRISNELKLIKMSKYLFLTTNLQEISKM